VQRPAQPSYIVIARIARSRGNRGEVLAELHTDFPDRFDDLVEVWVRHRDGRRFPLKIEESWEHKGRRVLKFAGIDSIDAASDLAGAWVEVPGEQAVELPEGTYFDHDLVGCAVESVGGEDLGTVKEVLRIAGNSQLVVEGTGGEILIPAVEPICRQILIDQKKIIVEVPEGLIDLNK
jgi:16S rRNA processing protein RimM